MKSKRLGVRSHPVENSFSSMFFLFKQPAKCMDLIETFQPDFTQDPNSDLLHPAISSS